MTADAFLRLALTGGSIVCSSQCTVGEIERAKATGRFYTVLEPGTTWGWGFVFMPSDHKMLGDGEPGPASVGA